MKKIKELFSNSIEGFKKNFKDYKVTNIIIFLVTLVLFIIVDSNYFSKLLGSEFIGKLTIFGITSCIGTFFVESTFTKKWNKIIGYVISILIGIAFQFFCFDTDAIIKNTIFRVLAGYIVSILAITLFFIIKKQKIEAHKYLLNIFQNLFNTGIAYCVLNIGLMIIVLIFSTLISSTYTLEIVLKIQVGLLGFFLIPSAIMALIKENTEVSKFIKGLVEYVLLPLVVIAVVIIYIYIAKIILLWQIPSNEIFRILAGIFIIAFPVWTMAYNYSNENKFIEKTSKILPIAFIPFLCLQSYSIISRTNTYGITPLRYLCYALLIFEVVAIVLSIYKKRKKLEITLVAISIIALFSTVMPFLNAYTLSNISQSKILQENWEKGKQYSDLNEKQKEKARGAYLYLRSLPDADKYIPEYISSDDINEISKDNYYLSEYIYFSMEKKNYNEKIDISKYSEMKTTAEYYSSTNLDGSKMDAKYEKLMNKIVEQYRIDKNTAETYFYNNNIIKLSDTEDLYIETISVQYEINSAEIQITSYSIKGYTFTK